MKTFDEAIKSVCLTKSGNKEYSAQIWDRQVRSKEIILEVCQHAGTNLLAWGLINNMNEENDLGHEMVIVVKNAIAQGVLIGMEMEKEEI